MIQNVKMQSKMKQMFENHFENQTNCWRWNSKRRKGENWKKKGIAKNVDCISRKEMQRRFQRFERKFGDSKMEEIFERLK